MPGHAESTTIRRLGEADLDAYKCLRDDSLRDHPTAFTSDTIEAAARDAASYRSRLGLGAADAGTFILGAFRGDALVAAVNCEQEQRGKARHLTHLTGMMVRTEVAGQGIGRALLDAVIEAIRAAPDLEMITLSVTAVNLTAARLYERAGFIRYGSLADAIKVDGKPYTKDLMVLRL